jgi:hypothetical protein
MLRWVVRGPLRSVSATLLGGLALGGMAAVWAPISGCGAEADEPLCNTITGSTSGIEVTNCGRGSITLNGIIYDASGLKTSYTFFVTCKGRSAYGMWSVAGGLACMEGTSPCDGGTCTPKSNLDCEVLTNCTSLGECGYVDGKCVLTDEGCSKSEVPCGLSGACHLVDGACAATSDGDCQRPFAGCRDCPFKGPCITTGACHAQNGACIVTDDADCKKAEQCAFAGKCTLDGEACVAASDADCARSEVCRTAGQCSAVAGTCAVQ